MGAEFGLVERIDWQARDTGWILDDLLIGCRTNGGDLRSVGFSYKSNRQLTQNGFPSDFVDLAWGQWLGVDGGRRLVRKSDAITLVTASISADVFADWSALLREILGTTPERVVSRLQSTPAQGSQSSKIQRSILDGFKCPNRYDHIATSEEVVQLLHDVRVLVFDFGNPSSRDASTALRDCRSVLSSSNAAEATELWERLVGVCDEMRPIGGMLNLELLLDRLRGQFHLRDHPDYWADIDLLRTRSASSMEVVESRIARIAHLPRTDIKDRVRKTLGDSRACILTGDSGSGKSALLKELSAEYDVTVWLSRDELDEATLVDLQKRLGLHHSIVETLNHVSGSCLVVFDGIESCSERALKLSAALHNKIREAGGSHIHVASSLQLDSVERVMRLLLGYAVPVNRLVTVPCERPDSSAIHNLLASFPGLQWLALRPELSPVLINLKVLDWFASVGPNSLPDADQPVTATGIIDALWSLWTEHSDDGPSRSYVLMKVARFEADTLSYGLSREKIAETQQSTLRGLEQVGLIRVKDDRVFLHHDLLGHWARLKILVSENPSDLSHLRSFALSPFWQPSIRLFGQRLLEGNDDSRLRWQQNVEIQADAPPAASITRDLFIDSLCLATNSEALLQRMWGALASHDGKLLKLLLNRFLVVATVPDPLIAALSAPDDATKVEHLVRVPNWLYWPGVLSFLYGKRDEVAAIAPYAAAKLCHLWLRTTAALKARNIEIPWRKEAAEIAYAIAREIQARNLESAYYSYGEDDPVFQAVLYAAPFLPDEVAALCLELAGRRPLDTVIEERVTRVKNTRTEERRAAVKDEMPKKRTAPPILRRWHRGEPWPDGPRHHVFPQFRTACLAGDPFMGLVEAKPNIALEVLLAVSIEEAPDADDFGDSGMPNAGLSYWDEGEPPAYFRGPFLAFLNKAPEEALSFILRLTNFATRRYTRERNWLDVEIAGATRRWYGDANVYRWHHDWPAHNASQVVSALMALEFWLYGEIKQDRSVDKWLARIVAESESLAFAGVLMNVGKLVPALFATVLKPLLFAWQFWEWDFQLATLQATDSMGPTGYWGHQARRLFELAAAFHRLPHRSEALLYPDGPIAKQMLGRAEYNSLFDEVRTAWEKHVDKDDHEDSLRLLIERIRPNNYSFEMQGNELVPVAFAWPEEIAKRTEASLERLRSEQQIRGLPFQCRKLIHASGAVPQDQVEWLWEFLQSLEPRLTALPQDRDDPNWEIIDACIAGIALLISKNLPWLQADPSRIAWCRKKLEETLSLSSVALHSEVSLGDRNWDSFAAECGIMLLVADPADRLARRLVAAAVTAFRYNTSKLVVARAAVVRAHLGEMFMRVVVLAVNWSATRPLARYQSQQDAISARMELMSRFEAGTMPISLPDLAHLSNKTQEILDENHERQYPGWRARGEQSRAAKEGERGRKLHARRLALDERVLTAAFGWLDLAEAANAVEEALWSTLVQDLLNLVLNRVPSIALDSDDRIEGAPSEFDNWILQTIANSIPYVEAADARDSLWKPILDRGAFAHYWVEHFFWHWFTNGFAAAGSANRFVDLWRPMIEYALVQSSWNPHKAPSFDVDRVVVQLLSLDGRWTKRLTLSENAAALAQLKEVFERALKYWGNSPLVVARFTEFVVLPGPSQFLVQALHWLLPHVQGFDAYDWKHGVEEAIIEYLGVCWAQKREGLSSDKNSREAFLILLALVTARGSPAAIALSRRIAG